MLRSATPDLNTADEVEESIGRHLAYIQSLKRLKNTRFVAIFRLPPEVLALIFEMMAFSNEIPPGNVRYRIFAHPCLHVAQVCSTWRDIALGLPRIWGLIYMNASNRWLREILRRSGSSPLFFREGRTDRTDASLSVLQEHIHRAKDIELWSDAEVTSLDFVFKASCPILEYLSVSGCDYPLYEYTGSAPRLRLLSLEDCIVNIACPFPALQTPIISFPLDVVSPCVTLLATLRHLPNLRYIKLHGPTDTLDFRDAKLTEPLIELPYLEHVEGRRLSWNFLCVLKQISAPWIEKLQLDLVLDDGTPPLPNIDNMFSVLPSPSTSHWRARSSKGFQSHFEFGMHYADIDLCISIYSSETHDADSAPIVEAKISFPVRGGSGSHIAAQAFSLLPAGQPEVMHVDCHLLSGTLFKPLVAALARIPEVVFDSPSSVSLLLDGGAPGSQAGGMGTPLDLPLHSLKTIYIIPKYALEDSEIAKMLETLPALRGTLHARKEVCPIEVLKLGRYMELPEEELGLLREIVKVELLDHATSDSMRTMPSIII